MERVVTNLNQAHHSLMQDDQDVFLIGEDLLDPYGGAFKVSRGLSSAFPDRVISTPISELGLLGAANGLVLAGRKVIAELMFGDFTFLAMDQIVNFAAKSVSMYGESMPFPLIVRCPVGGQRGYGATHSQTIQKHLIGVPDLNLYELSPLHDNTAMMRQIFQTQKPAVVFENKILYTHRQYETEEVDDLFTTRFLDEEKRVAVLETGEPAEVLLITGGGMLPICLEAARRLLLEAELAVDILVPYQLYPFPVDLIGQLLTGKPHIAVVEESTEGGTWGAELAADICKHHWDALPGRVHSIHSQDSIIPSARHLEKQVLVSSEQIVASLIDIC